MKALRSLVVLLGAAGCLVASSGCEVSDCSEEEEAKGTCVEGKSVKRFEGDAISKQVPYSAGQVLNIDSVHGEIDVKLGIAGQVIVNFKPFNTRAHDAETEARQQMAELVADVTTDQNNVNVKTTRGSGNEVGADIEILLPPEFNGAIVAKHHAAGTYGGGDIDFDFVGAAPSVNINNDSLIGGCFVSGSAALVSTVIRCNDDTTVRNVADYVDIQVKGIGDAKVQVSFSSISASVPESTIATEDAEIIAVFPVNANFTAFAETKQGTISELGLPSTCTVQGSGLIKTVACGTGGPSYRLAAGQDPVGDSNVTISFQ